MEEKKIKAYFKEQVRAILERSAAEPDGFRAYFADREPKEEEILGLLAISVMMNGAFPMSNRFPTPVEALAALSKASRAEVCREFRKGLKGCLKQLTPA